MTRQSFGAACASEINTSVIVLCGKKRRGEICGFFTQQSDCSLAF